MDYFFVWGCTFILQCAFKILVAEDDKELNRTVCTFLNHSGYEAVGCLDAEEAFDKMYENVFDLIVSDIMMPGIDGFEFAKTVRSLDENIPILFMTARDDFESKQRGFRVGIDDYMIKPVDLDELFLRIGALLRRAKIASSRKLEIGGFVMDADEHTAYLDGEEIPMTAREYKESLIKSFLDALSDGFSSVGNDAFGLLSASLAYCISFCPTRKRPSPALSSWTSSGT